MIDMTMALEIGKEVCGPFEYVYSSFLIVVCVRNVGYVFWTYYYQYKGWEAYNSS